MDYDWANGTELVKLVKTDAFDQWLRDIKDRTVRARIHARLDRLAIGNTGDCKTIAAGITELRLDFGPGYRIYMMRMYPATAILLCGGDKSSQRNDIRRAIELAAHWRSDHG